MSGTTWFLVADQSRVRVLTPSADAFLEIRAFDEPRVRESDGELMTGDDRGRRAESGGTGARSAMERKTSVQLTEILPFVHEVCEWLHVAQSRSAFDDLVVIAEPKMLGLLREKLATHANLKVVDSLAANVTSESLEELSARIRDAFPELVPTTNKAG